MVNMLKVMAAAAIFLLIMGIAMLGKRVRHILVFKTTKTRHSESAWLAVIAAIVGLGVAVTNYIMRRPEVNPAGWAGLAVFFAGGILQLFARKGLGDFKTLGEKMKADYESATKGIYKYIRHPEKFALLLMIFGFALALQSWWGLVLLVILFFPALLYRISQEENTLIDEFGELYINYQGEARKLIPGIF